MGWLDSKHMFSFGNYFHPELRGFGLLRVLNDDRMDPGAGFATHHHDNMEIVSIPLSGNLEHKDSTGKSRVIKEGDVQIMSAGTGIYHSEKNASQTKPVEFLQIWVFPKKRNLDPSYDQKTFSRENRLNQLQTIVDPGGKKGVKINQHSWFSLGKFDIEKRIPYAFNIKENGAFVFVLSGKVTIGNFLLGQRDAIGILETPSFEMVVKPQTEILIIEVPME